jgi:hypothetical protein
VTDGHPEPKREPKLNPKTGIVDRSDRKTKPPDTIPITEKHREWAAKNGVKVDLEKETEQMLDHFRGKGETRLDWEATWRTWMRNSITFGRNGGNGHGGHRETDFEKNNRALKAQLNSVLAPTLNWDLPDVREDDG